MRDRQSHPMRNGFGWVAYIQRIASLLLDAGDDPRFMPAPSQKVLTIRTGQHSAVDFDLSPQDKRELFQLGYDQCLTALRSRPDDLKPKPTLTRLLNEIDENLARLNEPAFAT